MEIVGALEPVGDRAEDAQANAFGLGVATDSYLEHIVERFGSDLSGLRIAVDCANGAYSGIAPTAFEQLGAEVRTVAADPDGENINVGCGATDLALLQGVVTDGGFSSACRPGRRVRRWSIGFSTSGRSGLLRCSLGRRLGSGRRRLPG